MLSRRAFVVRAAAGLVAASAVVQAQQRQPRLPRLAVVGVPGYPLEVLNENGIPRFQTVFGELRRLGWIEDSTLQVERWSAEGLGESQFERFARQVVATQPDIIFVNGGGIGQPLKSATAAIPIVFVMPDPIGQGMGQSLARPGGNATGLALGTGPENDQKRLQLLRDIAPNARRVAYFSTTNAVGELGRNALKDVADKLALALLPIENARPNRRAMDSGCIF